MAAALPKYDRAVRVAVLAAALSLAAGAAALAIAAGAGFPSEHKGRGNEPLAGGGTFAGKPYVPHSAVVEWDDFLKSLNVYLFKTKVDCAAFTDASSAGQLVHFVLDMPKGPKPVPIGSSLRGWFVEFETHPPNGGVKISELQIGVKVVFTRVDTTAGKSWHGRLVAPADAVGGKRFGYGGTFAATWCRGA
jgi:hypothetical protein